MCLTHPQTALALGPGEPGNGHKFTPRMEASQEQVYSERSVARLFEKLPRSGNLNPPRAHVRFSGRNPERPV